MQGINDGKSQVDKTQIKALLKAPLSEYFSTSLDHNDRFQDSIMEY